MLVLNQISIFFLLVLLSFEAFCIFRYSLAMPSSGNSGSSSPLADLPTDPWDLDKLEALPPGFAFALQTGNRQALEALASLHPRLTVPALSEAVMNLKQDEANKESLLRSFYQYIRDLVRRLSGALCVTSLAELKAQAADEEESEQSRSKKGSDWSVSIGMDTDRKMRATGIKK